MPILDFVVAEKTDPTKPPNCGDPSVFIFSDMVGTDLILNSEEVWASILPDKTIARDSTTG